MGGRGSQVNIGVGADFSQAERALEQFFANFKKRSQEAARTGLTGPQEDKTTATLFAKRLEAIKKLQAAVDQGDAKTVASAARAAATADTAWQKSYINQMLAAKKTADEQVKQAQKAAADIRKAQEQQGKVQAAALTGRLPSQQAEVAALKEQQRLGAEINASINARITAEQRAAAAVRKTQEATGALLAASTNRQNPGALKERQRQLDSLVTGTIPRANNAFQKMANVIDGADAKLARFGITSRDLSVILGAGLAGGVAFAIRSLFQFIGAAVQMAAQLETFRAVTDKVFGLAAEDVKEFANTAVETLGISERAALESANRLGLVFNNLGFRSQDVAKFSTSLTALASILARSTGGAQTTADAIEAISAAVTRAEFDPIEKFGITLKDVELRAKAVELGIAKTGEALSVSQRSVAAYSLILEKSGEQQALFGELGEKFPSQFAKFQATLEELQTSLGEGFLPIVINLIESLNILIKPFADLVSSISKAKELLEFEAAKEGASNLDKLKASLGKIATSSPVASLQDLINKIRGVEDAEVDLLSTQEAVDAFFESEQKAAEATAADIERLKNLVEQLADAELRLDRAKADAIRNEERAWKELHQAREDGVRKVFRAERNLIRAQRDAARSIADAQEDVADARLQGFRDIRAAREALADFEVDSLRSVEEAERSLKRAQKERIDNIYDAQRALFDALVAGDAQAELQARVELERASRSETVEDAKRKLEEERAERLKELALLERDLAEARLDAADAIADAQRELAREIEDANEKIADAQEAVQDAMRESERAIIAAEQRVTDAIREGEEAVLDASTAVSRLVTEYDELEKKLAGVNRQLDLIAEGLKDIQVQGGLVGEDVVGLTPGLAHGGHFQMGRPRLVGEIGPELEIPHYPGAIVSNADIITALQDIFGTQGKSGGFSIVVNEVANDPQATAFAVSARLAAEVNS